MITPSMGGEPVGADYATGWSAGGADFSDEDMQKVIPSTTNNQQIP